MLLFEFAKQIKSMIFKFRKSIPDLFVVEELRGLMTLNGIHDVVHFDGEASGSVKCDFSVWMTLVILLENGSWMCH